MRALTNDYKDCKIIKIDPADPTSPYGIMQEGYDPNDPTYRTRMFYLQRDGQWIDEIARSARPDSEGGDVLFKTSAGALELLGKLRGKPVVRDLPVSKDDVKNYLESFYSLVKNSKDVKRIFVDSGCTKNPYM